VRGGTEAVRALEPSAMRAAAAEEGAGRSVAAPRRSVGEGSTPGWAWVLLGLAAGLAAAAAFAMPPAGDDWSTLRPVFAWSPELLLPGLFWRPLGNVLLLAGANFPALHVAWMHAWTVAGHLASSALVWLLARRTSPGSSTVPVLAAALYSVWGGNAAAALSADAAIQTWSTAWGLMATLLVLRALEGKCSGWLWPMAAVLAALWKESGIAWFVAAPLLAVWLVRLPEGRPSWQQSGPSRRSLAALLLAGGVLVGAYFAGRFALAGQVSLGDESGRYALALSPLGVATRAGLLLGAALLPLDTVALFGTPQQPLLVVATALLAAPCLLLLGATSCGRWGRYAAVLLFAGVVASPPLVLGHVSEMYVHPIAAVLFLGGAELAAAAAVRWPRRLVASCALLAVASLVAFSHKVWEMRRAGEAALAVAVEVERQLLEQERPCLLRLGSEERSVGVYSVFQMPPGPAAQWGESVMLLHGWRLPLPVVDSRDCSESCRTLLRVARDGTVTALPCTPPAAASSAREPWLGQGWPARAGKGETLGVGGG